MKNVMILFIVLFLPVCLFATGMSEKDLLCDLSSPTTLPVILDDNYGYDQLNSTVALQLEDRTVYYGISVCVISETETSVLGIRRQRRDIVEIPYKSPAVVAKEREQNPDLIEIGYFVRRFHELKAPLGEWHLSPYTPVEMVSVDASDTVTGIVDQAAIMNLAPETNLLYRIVVVDLTDKLSEITP